VPPAVSRKRVSTPQSRHRRGAVGTLTKLTIMANEAPPQTDEVYFRGV